MNETAGQAVMNTYNRIKVDFDHGEGSFLYDTKGNKYLDAISGIAVCALGHNHAGFTRAIGEQAARLVHTSNLYGIPLQRELAEKLCAAAGMDQAFFCNSGAEANEAAIKLARMYGHNKGVELPTIVVMEGAFHGRTMGALSATHNNKHQAGFDPLLPGFVRVPYNDAAAVEEIARNDPNAVAVLLEPVQGEGGVRLPSPGYLQQLRQVCDQHELLLMLDEVQTGNGRTGRYFACQHEAVVPDVLTTAKGLGNGFPIGACLAAGRARDVFQPGHHASTFGGSPLACAAALAVHKALMDDKLVDHAARMGEHILTGLRRALADCSHMQEVRGLGLMLGVELSRPCGELVELGRQQGLLINVAAGKVVRLLPPLIVTADEADLIVAGVSRIIRELRDVG